MKLFFLVMAILLFTIDSIAQIPLSKKDQKRKAEFEALIAAEKKYDELLIEADEAFQEKEYVTARMKYQEAIQYSPENEQWLISKVNDLDILMARIIAREIDSVLVMSGKPVQRLETKEDEMPAVDTRIDTMEIAQLPEEPAERPASPVEDDEGKLVEPEPKKQPEKREVNSVKPKVDKREEKVKVKEDFSKYPQGMTEETFEFPNHTVTRIIVKDGIDTIVYKYVTHRWGGKFHFKDDVSMSQRIWEQEVEEFRKKYPTENDSE